MRYFETLAINMGIRKMTKEECEKRIERINREEEYFGTVACYRQREQMVSKYLEIKEKFKDVENELDKRGITIEMAVANPEKEKTLRVIGAGKGYFANEGDDIIDEEFKYRGEIPFPWWLAIICNDEENESWFYEEMEKKGIELYISGEADLYAGDPRVRHFLEEISFEFDETMKIIFGLDK